MRAGVDTMGLQIATIDAFVKIESQADDGLRFFALLFAFAVVPGGGSYTHQRVRHGASSRAVVGAGMLLLLLLIHYIGNRVGARALLSGNISHCVIRGRDVGWAW